VFAAMFGQVAAVAEGEVPKDVTLEEQQFQKRTIDCACQMLATVAGMEDGFEGS